jgi:beta-galactosidase
MKNVYAADAMRAMGFPFTVLEMQLGTYSQIPPVLGEDLHQWYMLNLALGMKGVSYYIFTGGENPPHFGMTADVYDFQAPVSANGEIRKNYQVLKDFNLFMKSKPWLLEAERKTSVQLGVEWQSMRGNGYAEYAGVPNTLQTEDRLIKCLSMSLFSSKYAHGFVELTGDLDITKPLIVMCPDTMSRAAQQNVVDFMEKGGNVYLLATLPTLDENFTPCTILRDYIGEFSTEKNAVTRWVTLICGERVYYVTCPDVITAMPAGAEAFATDESGRLTFGFRMQKGKGKLYYLAGQWLTKDEIQVSAMEKVLEDLGAKPCVEHSNLNVYATLLSDGKRRAWFVINLYTGAQQSHIRVHDGEETIDLGVIDLAPAEVRYIEL